MKDEQDVTFSKHVHSLPRNSDQKQRGRMKINTGGKRESKGNGERGDLIPW